MTTQQQERREATQIVAHTRGMLAADIIDSFSGPWHGLSNFAACPVQLNGLPWPTAEHAFQSFKAASPHDRARIFDAPTPRDAKRLGRTVRMCDDWERVKKRVMLDVVMAKFTQNDASRDLLCSTGDSLLIEGNTWHDQFWGDCTCGRSQCTAPGANYLGKILMAVRMILRDDPR